MPNHRLEPRSKKSKSGTVRGAVLRIAVLAAMSWPGAAAAQNADERAALVIGANRYLSDGAAAIRNGRFDEGIRLTRLGLERGTPSIRERAAGHANLCAAYVSKEEPDEAIEHCTESLQLDGRNWRAYSNRSHAWLLKGNRAAAARDNEAAAEIAPQAPHVRMIREALNEEGLKPSITMREHR